MGIVIFFYSNAFIFGKLQSFLVNCNLLSEMQFSENSAVIFFNEYAIYKKIKLSSFFRI